MNWAMGIRNTKALPSIIITTESERYSSETARQKIPNGYTNSLNTFERIRVRKRVTENETLERHSGDSWRVE